MITGRCVKRGDVLTLPQRFNKIERRKTLSKPHVLLLGAYRGPDMEVLSQAFHLHKLWEQPDQAAYIKANANQIRALATRGDLGAKKELIDQLPNLEIIACNGVGVDAIDLATCRSRNIKVTNTPGVLNEDVADLALALMLAIARHIPQANAFTRQGHWATAPYPLMTRMNTKRLGVLGMGRIGQAIARRAQGFAMPIAYCSRKANPDVGYKYYDSAIELARNSDFLVAIVPGGAGTEKLVNAEVLSALGPNGYFINVARGSVADEDALLKALQTNSIAGAALDVFWNEPNINPNFLKLQNVVLHPHGGSGTHETRQAMFDLVQNNLEAHFSGKELLTPVP